MNVIKRDGRMEPFDEDKMKGSIKKAMIDAQLFVEEQADEINDMAAEVLVEIGSDDVDVSELRNKILEVLEEKKPPAAAAWREFDGKYKAN
ncbi:hypothetical protein K9M79_03655 [Candidatus Woesearchaeota archaeon]|nr:hypothetical protein [Candidatus Woesearchaeota archaeon]